MCHRAPVVADWVHRIWLVGLAFGARTARPGRRRARDGDETGWAALKAEQVAYLDDFWRDADIELDGDAELQQAVRFSLFHVLQAGAAAVLRHPAKGLTGPATTATPSGDTESFILPMLTYTAPRRPVRSCAGGTPRWNKAKARAAELGQRGAMFPWRSINGDRCSGYWPGTAGVHDIGPTSPTPTARHLRATDDEKFETECGVELLVETGTIVRRTSAITTTSTASSASTA